MIMVWSFVILNICMLLCFLFKRFEIKYNNNLKSIIFAGTAFVNVLFAYGIGLCMVPDACILDQYLHLVFFDSILFSCDVLSCWFIFLTTLLVAICILVIWNSDKFNSISFFLLMLQMFLLVTLSCSDLLTFYIFFEAVVIPMYFLIGMEGSRERKIRAGYLFFFYTFGGSILMFASLVYIYVQVGSLSFYMVESHCFTFFEQCILWLTFFLSFSSKIPMFPFHIWLPEAHVEAPTVGSVLLAGILLKLGVYGFVRVNLLMFPLASYYYAPLVHLLGVLGIILASLAAIRQTDLKRVIAYSSVAHMSLVAMGIFSFNIIGIEGAIVQSISHGFVASALFLLIGVLYERYHSRSIQYYGGLIMVMPLFGIFFLTFIMCNIALPGTSSFVGEFLLLSGIYKQNIFVSILAALNVVLCGIYSLWFFNRIMYANLKNYAVFFSDLNFREFIYLFPLFVFSILFGVYPYMLTVTLKPFINGVFSFLV